jgi:hypothetical protein
MERHMKVGDRYIIFLKKIGEQQVFIRAEKFDNLNVIKKLLNDKNN